MSTAATETVVLPTLCVELAGALVAGNPVHDAILLRIRRGNVVPDVSRLPYRGDVVQHLREQKQAGRRIVLVANSNAALARAVADHLGLFDDVVIGAPPSTPSETLSAAEVARSGRFAPGPSRARAIIDAIRPHQWIKNLLVLLPLVLAHKTGDWYRVNESLAAFLAFCCCASGVYVLNDLLDIELDRHHPRKRNRPFAAGTLPVPIGLWLAGGLLAVAFLIAATRGWRFAGILALYFLCTTAYSLFFKGRLLMDVFVLAGLYTLRLIAGAVAVSVVLSPWLLAFSMFFFLSLAFVKRYGELQLLRHSDSGEVATRGRGYHVDDLDIIQTVGPTSGYLAVLVFCQYISSAEAASLYRRPFLLWIIAPVLLYWVTRLWFLARRRVLHDDPIVFAITDKMSWACGAAIALLALAATV